jgi:hypothetical protein
MIAGGCFGEALLSREKRPLHAITQWIDRTAGQQRGRTVERVADYQLLILSERGVVNSPRIIEASKNLVHCVVHY